MRCSSLRLARVSCVAFSLLLSPAAAGDSPESDGTGPSPRRTETVTLIERCLPAVVSVMAEVETSDGKREGRYGSGAVIHSHGFVLTAEHVVRGMKRGVVVYSDGSAEPMRIVAAFPHEDLAVLQVRTSRPRTALPLGRSDDLMLGEPALVIGTPGGLVHSVSTGIVSGLNRSTRNESNFLPWVIQTTAAVSKGNSGGPLINALGEQIGVMATLGNDLQNVSFAIAIDRVREVLPHMLASEERQNVWFGATCDPLAPEAVVTEVNADSPAAKAGLEPGDVLKKVRNVPLSVGAHLDLALIGAKSGESAVVDLEREGEAMRLVVDLTELSLPTPVPGEGLTSGLHYGIYRGEWEALSDFKSLTPESEGRCQTPHPKEISAPDENVALLFEGFIRIPDDGLYTFYTTSDDGSGLWIGDRHVVENDGAHPARESGGVIRLPAGLHPLRIEFFERSGAEFLEVAIEGPELPKQSLTAEMLFARPDESTAAKASD